MLSWQEWTDMMFYEYGWDYPSTDEDNLIKDVLYDVAYSNHYCSTSSDYCTETELASCISSKGSCIWNAFDEFFATANVSTSSTYEGYGTTNGYNYLWYQLGQSAPTNYRGYRPAENMFQGWDSYWSFSFNNGGGYFNAYNTWLNTIENACGNYGYYDYGMDYWYAVSCFQNYGGFSMFRDGYFKA